MECLCWRRSESLPGGDEGVDTRLGQLEHQATADQHGENPVLHAEGAAAETAAALRRQHSRDAEQLVYQLLEPLLRPPPVASYMTPFCPPPLTKPGRSARALMAGFTVALDHSWGKG
jgi:hypothetical protein